MPSAKKNSADFRGADGRQSSLLKFFQRTPKHEDEKIISDEKDANRENTLPNPNDDNLKHQTPTSLRGQRQGNNCSVGSITKTKNTPTLLTSSSCVLSSDDDDDGVGFLSCSFSTITEPPTKRSRIVISSDEEEEVNKMTSKSSHNTIPTQKTKNGIGHAIVETNSNSNTSASLNSDVNEIHLIEDTKVGVENSGSETKQRRGDFTQSFIDSFSFDSTFDTQTSSWNRDQNNETKIPRSEKAKQKFDEDALASREFSSGECERFPHLDYEFLKPDKMKDAQGKSISDPEYDCRTLYIPKKFLDDQSPGHQQWWKLKAAHFDTILFFKVGKFYELYHMDAVVAVENLGLTYMRGKFAHCGFPEIGYGRFADQLVNRGYKVARVEQTETPQQLNERQKNTKKTTTRNSTKEKVVRREICRITTQGTKNYGILDGTDCREMDGTTDPDVSYLMALTEQKGGYKTNGTTVFRYGCCFVDCSVGRFVLSEFDDDLSQSNLRTLLAHNYPAQLLYAKGVLSTATMTLLNTMLANVPKEALFLNRQFQTAENTLTMLCDDNYFGTNREQWPGTLLQTLADSSASIPQPKPNRRLCLSAFGAVLWYLQECLIDVETISMRQFEYYSPPSILDFSDGTKLVESDSASRWKDKHMVLDGVSLLNLHILPALSLSGQSRTVAANRAFTGMSFSLYSTINRCQTAFGKRLLRQWISAPSCCPNILLSRQNAIQWLSTEWMRPHIIKWSELLRKVPDLERLFQRIHTIGQKYRAEPKNGHPDARAQLFEADKYNKRKIRDLLIVLDGLEAVQRLIRLFQYANEHANEGAPPLLQKCLASNISEMDEDMEFFKLAFDRESAMENGIILPHTGVDPDYDQSCSAIDQCKHQLNKYLEQIKRELKCTTVKFIGTGRMNYHLEIPDAYCKFITNEFQLSSQRKGFKRYTTPELARLIAQLDEAMARCNTISAEVTRRVFADFDARKNKWSAIVNHMATFDCLLALALYAHGSSQQMCIPEFDFNSNQPYLIIERGYHPTLIGSKIGANNNNDIDYIPNSCHLGTTDKEPHTMLLTGPNMGGKSTYMRQVASLVVLAQIGSMVPADSMRLTPVDRIFCRIGASDCLSIGQSTFYVELSETNTILRQATPNSLVLIDELGRGTSTHDGTAIACAILKHITRKIHCRTLFSTHYHVLCKFVANNPEIQFTHMACVVEDANLDDPTLESITFLYTLSAGMCDKSYGFYTAKMAGLDVKIVRKAFESSHMLER